MSISDNGGVSRSLPRWFLAVAIGAPLTVGLLGYYYYRKKSADGLSSDKNSSQKCRASKKSGKADSTDVRDSVPKTPLDRVLNLKNSGNEFFKKGKIDDAIKCYSEAITICPPEETQHLAILYQNRGACYESLNELENVLKDVSKALELNPRYMKALTRRWKVTEKLGDYRLSVEDLTTLCILEKFSNIDTLTVIDRVLKKLGEVEGREALSKRVPCLPSVHFIHTYFAAFSNDPIMISIKNNELEQGDIPLTGFNAAKKAYTEGKFDDIIMNCNTQIEHELSKGEHSELLYLSLLFRASMLILKTDYERAVQDIERIVSDGKADKKIIVNALVKRASVYLQLDCADKCLADYAVALSLDPSNSDIYHHRGQIYLLLDKIDEAVDEFNTAHHYNPTNELLQAQRLYTIYRYSVVKQNTSAANEALEELKLIAKKKNCVVEAALLLAQIYTDQQENEKAEESFNKALHDDPTNATILVHKGLLELQWHQNVSKAIQYMEEAIALDPLLEFAYETLASVEVQRGELVRAVSLFETALKLAKSEREMAHICALKAAAETQQKVAKKMGVTSFNMVSGASFS